MRVLRARHVADPVFGERSEKGARAERQVLEPGVPDPPDPAHLLHHELGVQADVDGGRATPSCLLEAEDEGVVLRDVVRRAPEPARELRDDVAALVQQHRAGAGRPRVPSRGAVRVDDEAAVLGHSASSCASRARSTLPPETIATTRSPGRARTAPPRSAPVAAAPAGSATSFARGGRNRTPSRMTPPPTPITPATRRRPISSATVPPMGPP